jgi:hypothetical protein
MSITTILNFILLYDTPNAIVQLMVDEYCSEIEVALKGSNTLTK